METNKKQKDIREIYNKFYNWDKVLKFKLINKYNDEKIKSIIRDYTLRPLWWALSLILYEKIVSSLKKNNMYEYFVPDGGTFLSSIRYDGFMAWDDDLDFGLFVTKKMYNEQIQNFIRDFLENNGTCFNATVWVLKDKDIGKRVHISKYQKGTVSLTEPTDHRGIFNIKDINGDNLIWFNFIIKLDIYEQILKTFGIDYSKDVKYSKTMSSLKKPWCDFFPYLTTDGKTYVSTYGWKDNTWKYDKDIVYPLKSRKLVDQHINIPNLGKDYFKVMYGPKSDIGSIEIRSPHGTKGVLKRIIMRNTSELISVIKDYNEHIMNILPIVRSVYKNICEIHSGGKINYKYKYYKYKSKYLDLKN